MKQGTPTLRGRAMPALLAALFTLPGYAAPAGTTQPVRAYTFHHENVLGTSLELTFVSASADAAVRAESVALAEIERVRRVISTWDSTSEASRLIATGHLDPASPELLDVLRLYDAWQARSGGAWSARVGELTALWRQAERAGRAPSPNTLLDRAAASAGPAWRIDPRTGGVTALTRHALDLNSLGKGYILGRAEAAVRAAVPGVRGGLLDIGGDVRTWGDAPAGAAGAWRVAVANPQDPADNAAPLTLLRVHDAAVSSSGSYARGFDIAGHHYSHIIDARTGQTAEGNSGVTVIAADNATANALATTLSVLSPAEGLRLVASEPGAEALIITGQGEQYRSPGFAAYESPPAQQSAARDPGPGSVTAGDGDQCDARQLEPAPPLRRRLGDGHDGPARAHARILGQPTQVPA